MRVIRELVVRARPASVFRWIASPELARRWQPEVLEYEITKAGAGVAGTEFREVIGDEAGRMQMLGRVTDYAPDSVIAFELVGKGIIVRSRYAVTAAPEGTRLRVESEFQVGGLLSIVVEPFVRRRMQRQVDAELERLRRLCESESHPDAGS